MSECRYKKTIGIYYASALELICIIIFPIYIKKS